MPWTAKSFAAKHNHALGGDKAAKAAAMANAILKKTGDEGKAIRIANARARADGGSADIEHAIRVAQRAVGGYAPPSPSYAQRQAMREVEEGVNPYGFTAGVGLGRHDRNNVTIGSGGYVIPADIIAGLGDGNSIAGANVWDKILNSMPWGITPPKFSGRRAPPSPPHDAQLMQGVTGGQSHLAEGGEAEEDGVPVKTADGEWLMSPEQVLRVGQHYSPQRDLDSYPESHDRIMRRGHRVLDQWIKLERGQNIKHLKSLKGPVGSADASKGHI